MNNIKKYNIIFDKLPGYLFVFSLCTMIFCYGYFVHRNHLFPYSILQEGTAEIKLLLYKISGDNKDDDEDGLYNTWYYQKTDFTENIPSYDENNTSSGLSLITSVAGNKSLSVKIIDMQGLNIHEWNVDWFDIWPDATHIPEADMPKSKPGTHIHGTVLLDSGDLIFNYEHLGLVRLDFCGNVVWKLPYRTHHSIYLDEYNTLWVSGQKNHETPLPDFPNYTPIFIEPIILNISLEGEILSEISIMDLLKDNDLQSLLYISSKKNWSTEISGDALHLNDVEVFPSYMEEGVFEAGDIMISLRNINTIIIFREKPQKVKYVIIGEFVRQHDPDFIDGNTISIFDNNNIAPKDYGHQSRILIKSFTDNKTNVYYSGSEFNPFYTDIAGKHQWLQNGNLLITEATKGRAFELDRNGRIVWEYINLVGDGYVGLLEEAQRLPSDFTKELINIKIQECRKAHRKN